MTKESPNVFVASPGDTIRITVRSVNFNLNAQLDPKLTPINTAQFIEVGELVTGTDEVDFAVAYNFPDPLPDGGKYTRTINGPGGFVDGPFDINAGLPDQPIVLVYTVKIAAAVEAAQTGKVGGGAGGN